MFINFFLKYFLNFFLVFFSQLLNFFSNYFQCVRISYKIQKMRKIWKNSWVVLKNNFTTVEISLKISLNFFPIFTDFRTFMKKWWDFSEALIFDNLPEFLPIMFFFYFLEFFPQLLKFFRINFNVLEFLIKFKK